MSKKALFRIPKLSLRKNFKLPTKLDNNTLLWGGLLVGGIWLLGINPSTRQFDLLAMLNMSKVPTPMSPPPSQPSLNHDVSNMPENQDLTSFYANNQATTVPNMTFDDNVSAASDSLQTVDVFDSTSSWANLGWYENNVDGGNVKSSEQDIATGEDLFNGILTTSTPRVYNAKLNYNDGGIYSAVSI